MITYETRRAGQRADASQPSKARGHVYRRTLALQGVPNWQPVRVCPLTPTVDTYYQSSLESSQSYESTTLACTSCNSLFSHLPAFVTSGSEAG